MFVVQFKSIDDGIEKLLIKKGNIVLPDTYPLPKDRKERVYQLDYTLQQ